MSNWTVLNTNIYPHEAKELYPDGHIVMLIPDTHDEDVKGDVLFVGDDLGVGRFVRSNESPIGYTFYTIRGINVGY